MMRQWVVSYLRLVAFSAAALGLAACVKLNPGGGPTGRPEPLLGEPPAALHMSDAEQIQSLKDHVERLEVELSSLRKALDVMGPLPQQNDFFIAVAPSDITGDVPSTDPETEAAARLARLYAPPPYFSNSRTLFYEADLGAFPSRAAAEKGWKRLVADKRLAGLKPRYSVESSDIRLIAGPLASEAAVTSLCVELSALAGQCRVAAPIRAF